MLRREDRLCGIVSNGPLCHLNVTLKRTSVPRIWTEIRWVLWTCPNKPRRNAFHVFLLQSLRFYCFNQRFPSAVRATTNYVRLLVRRQLNCFVLGWCHAVPWDASLCPFPYLLSLCQLLNIFLSSFDVRKWWILTFSTQIWVVLSLIKLAL